MLADMLETDPKYRPSGDVAVWESERIPSDAQLLQKTALEFVRRPEKMVRLNVRVLRQLASSTRSGGLKAMADVAAQPMPGPLGDALRQRLRGGNEIDTPPALPTDAGAPHAVQPLDHAPPALRLHVDPAGRRQDR